MIENKPAPALVIAIQRPAGCPSIPLRGALHAVATALNRLAESGENVAFATVRSDGSYYVYSGAVSMSLDDPQPLPEETPAL